MNEYTQLYKLAGGCTCLTKTPEVKYHDPRCCYRLSTEIAGYLAATTVSPQGDSEQPEREGE